VQSDDNATKEGNSTMKTNNSTQYVGLLRKMYAVSNIWAHSLFAVYLVVLYFGLSVQTATYELSRKCEFEMFINKIKKCNESQLPVCRVCAVWNCHRGICLKALVYFLVIKIRRGFFVVPLSDTVISSVRLGNWVHACKRMVGDEGTMRHLQPSL